MTCRLGNDARKKVEEIRAAIIAGKSWKEAGREAYQDLGFVKLDELRSEFRDALIKLQPEEASEIIRFDRGLVLLVKSKAADAGDEKFRSEIRNMLYQSRLKEAMEKLVNEELPKKYHVEMKL